MSYLNRIEHPVYYNDFDEGAVAWLGELMKQGHIPPGEIDARSILDLCVSDLKGFTQAHFFAGIAGWPLALRLAGVPVDISLWTGSLPCQPFSVAGRQESQKDERHLAPHFLDLVRGARPGMLFGEQVASAEVFGKAPKRVRGNAVPPPDWAWIDDVSERLEAARYAIGTNDFPSSSVGAPHIRQRTYFGAVAQEWLEHASGHGWIEWWTQSSEWGTGCGCGDDRLAEFDGEGSLPGSQRGIHRGEEVTGSWDGEPERLGSNGRLGDSDNKRLEGWSESGCKCSDERSSWSSGVVGGLADFDSDGRETRREIQSVRSEHDIEHGSSSIQLDNGRRPGPTNGFWGTADWLFSRDERWRPVEPGTFPLAHGISGRVGLLRGYGNAINCRQAAIFIQAFFETLKTITSEPEHATDLSLDGLII